MKTQIRPHVVPSKLDWVPDEVALHGKGVIGSEASQMPDTWSRLDFSVFNKEELGMIQVYFEKKKKGEKLIEEEKIILRQAAIKIKKQDIF